VAPPPPLFARPTLEKHSYTLSSLYPCGVKFAKMSSASGAGGAPVPKKKKGRAFVVMKEVRRTGGLLEWTESVCGQESGFLFLLSFFLSSLKFLSLFSLYCSVDVSHVSGGYQTG
jgi:hypothetical protein